MGVTAHAAAGCLTSQLKGPIQQAKIEAGIDSPVDDGQDNEDDEAEAAPAPARGNKGE